MENYKDRGFTLIELLIVMAILGVLAVVVLVAINPVQQLARTRDAGRKSAVTQVGRALEAFYTTHSGKYLYARTATAKNCDTNSDNTFSDADDWLTCLKSAGEISTEPALIKYSVAGTAVCALDTTAYPYSSEENGLCYAVNTSESRAVVYARLESTSEASKCPSGSPIPYFVWSTFDGRGGLTCTSAVTVVPAPGTISFVD